jgi:hypothetical protein
MRIVIYASELAGLCGRNRYQSQQESIEKFWCRIKKIPNKEQILESKLTNEQKEIIYKNIGTIENTENLTSHIQEIQKVVTTHSDFETVENKKEICKMVEKLHQTEYGTKKEEMTRVNVEKSHEIDIKKDDVFHSRFLFETPQYKVYLGGKCDGTTIWQGDKTLVEIKNRINRLFHKIPDYEKVQLLAYMYIFKINKSILIENYNCQKNIIEYDFDEQEWIQIMNDLQLLLNE